MALDPKSAQDLLNKLKEIERLSKELGKNINLVNLQPIEENVGAIEALFKSLNNEAKHLGEDTEYLISNFRELVSQTKNYSQGLNASTKSFRSLTDISEKLNFSQRGLNNLTTKDLKTLQERASLEKARLSSAQKTLQNEMLLERYSAENLKNDKIAYNQLQNIKKSEAEIDALIKGQDVSLTELNNNLEKELKRVTDIEKKIGLTGISLKGISKIPFIGDVVDTEKALKASRDNIEDGKSSLSGMGAALKSVGKDVKMALTDPLTIGLFLFKQMFTAITNLDKGIGDFAKGMNMSYQDAAKLDNTFNNIANSSNDVNVTTKGIRDSVLAIGQALGSNATLNEKDAVAMTKFREQAGLAQDELSEMQKLSLATGKSIESNVADTLYSAKVTALKNGVLLNEKQIMSDVAKSSAATKLSLGNTPGLIAQAAAQAKALGMNLEQVSNIANSLLQIESSINSELEAELLLGKNLNLEQARLYALNNDMEGLSKEIAKNYGSAAEFSKMNRIQQEAAAKAVGMSREELAKTLTDQEALKGLSGKQAEDAKAALEAARARGMSEEEIKRQGVEGLMKQQSIQEKLNASVEKLKELFVSLAEPLMPVLDALSSILSLVGYILKPIGLLFDMFGKIGSAISNMIGPLGAVGKLVKSLAGLAIVFAAYKAYASLATIPVVGVPLGIAAAAAAMGAGFSALTKIKDGAIDPKGGLIVSGEKGSIQLDKDDSIIAGTNLGGNKNKQSSGGSSDNAALLAAINQLIAATNAQNQKPINVAVNMDGKKVAEGLGNHATQLGTSANVGTSKIQ